MTTMTAPVGTQPGFGTIPTGFIPGQIPGQIPSPIAGTVYGNPGAYVNSYTGQPVNPYVGQYVGQFNSGGTIPTNFHNVIPGNTTPWLGGYPMGTNPMSTLPLGGFNPHTIAGQCIGNPWGVTNPTTPGYGTTNEMTTGWVNTPYGPVPVGAFTQPFGTLPVFGGQQTSPYIIGQFYNGQFYGNSSTWPTNWTNFTNPFGWSTSGFQNGYVNGVQNFPTFGGTIPTGFGTPNYGWNTTPFINNGYGAFGYNWSNNGPIGFGGLFNTPFNSTFNTPFGFNTPFNFGTPFNFNTPFSFGTPFNTLGFNTPFNWINGITPFGVNSGVVNPWSSVTPWANFGGIGTIPTFGGFYGQPLGFGGVTPFGVNTGLVPFHSAGYIPGYGVNVQPQAGFVPGANTPGYVAGAHVGNGVPGYATPGVSAPTENIERSGKRGVNMGREAA